MYQRLFATVLIAAAVSGCAPHEGRYSPSCVAFAGSNIELRDGRFIWEKFTDQVLVDDEGKIVNQFPGYPMRGTYRIDGQSVYMTSDDGESVVEMNLQKRDENYHLLTVEQFAALEESGNMPDCALVLDVNPAD